MVNNHKEGGFSMLDGAVLETSGWDEEVNTSYSMHTVQGSATDITACQLLTK